MCVGLSQTGSEKIFTFSSEIKTKIVLLVEEISVKSQKDPQYLICTQTGFYISSVFDCNRILLILRSTCLYQIAACRKSF